MDRYKLINGWTKQMMIDAIIKGNNGTPAVRVETDGSTVMYKTSTGNKCAVGCLLPEDSPQEVWEFDGGVVSLLNIYPYLVDKLPLNRYALEKFQAIHDTYAPKMNVRTRMLTWIHLLVE